ncbi:MAG: GrpB family protein [Bacteroidales bacterium]|nr:GrpB family protein [Bacteroidales bacterium]
MHIHHIGSTAVPDLKAKPAIDILKLFPAKITVSLFS